MKTHEDTTMLLDKNARACAQTDAVLTAAQHRDSLRVETYNPELAEKARRLALSLGKDPVGGPNLTGSMKLGGFSFEWETNRWAHESPTFSILIEPECSREQSETVIKTISRIEPILKRQILHRENLTFHIGGEIEKPCVGFAKGNTIGIPKAETKCHLLAVCLEQSSEISLEGILLHEIGHTLQKYLSGGMGDITACITGGRFELLKPEMERISPHYLGKQFDAIKTHLEILTATNLIEPKRESEAELRAFRRKITAEIFAETVRTYYLENCLGRSPVPIKTGEFNFDSFVRDLLDEAEITKTYRMGSPPFPQREEADLD